MSITTSAACPCTDTQDPQVVTNPPGLSSIADRVDDFTGFRRALLAPLAGEQAIASWRPAPGDLGLQILEWWAYLADVLTFYNERIANESYLRTAIQPTSLANLVALLGYQPAPGIAATGTVAAIRKPTFPAEPLVIPAGMRLSSVASASVPSQTFEVDQTESFSGPSSVAATLLPSSGDRTFQTNSDGAWAVLLAGRVTGVQVGDQLVLAPSSFAGADDNWSLVTVQAISPQTDPGTGVANTLVTFSLPGWGPAPWSQSLSQPADATAFQLLRPTAAAALMSLTEANAVNLASSTVDLAATLRAISPGDVVLFQEPAPGALVAQTPTLAGSPVAVALAVVTSTSDVLSNAPYPTGPSGVSPSSGPAGSTVTVTGETFSSNAQVLFGGAAGTNSHASDNQWTVTVPPGSGTVAVTLVLEAGGNPTPIGSFTYSPGIVIAHTTLGLALGFYSHLGLGAATQSGLILRYGLKQVGTIIPRPLASLSTLPVTVQVPATYTDTLTADDTSALLQDATGAGVLVTVSYTDSGEVTLAGAGTPPSSVPTAGLVVPLQLLLDVVPVSRGTTVTDEVLGSGDATLINQAFALSKSPLTYLPGATGPASTLAVYVNGVQWREVPSFYGQAPNAAVFVVSRSADQTVTTVTFGDGVNGARLASGSGNVLATYRYGSGAASPPAGRLTTIGQPQPNLASLQNPVAVSGGADPQSPEDVRINAPSSVATFARAISAADYEVIAAQAPGVTRAAVSWTFDVQAQRAAVSIYVGDDEAAVAAASAAIAGVGDPNRPVSVLAATPIQIDLECQLVVAAAYQASTVVDAATAAISDPVAGLFSPARMGIGQPLYRSAVLATLMVAGVSAVHDLQLKIQQVPSTDEVLEPGADSFFMLAADAVTIQVVSASD